MKASDTQLGDEAVVALAAALGKKSCLGSDQLYLRDAVLVAGLFPNLARIRRSGKGRTMQGLEVCVHGTGRHFGTSVITKGDLHVAVDEGIPHVEDAVQISPED